MTDAASREAREHQKSPTILCKGSMDSPVHTLTPDSSVETVREHISAVKVPIPVAVGSDRVRSPVS